MIIIGRAEGDVPNCYQKKCSALSFVGCVQSQGTLRGSKIEVKLTAGFAVRILPFYGMDEDNEGEEMEPIKQTRGELL
jgi:hypothetical protein